jgi:hypothetical protein
MTRSTAALLLLLVCFSATTAERIAVELGQGIHNNRHDSGALFARYIGDTSTQMLVGHNFYEWSLGAWDGRYRNNAVGLALGTRGQWNPYHLDASIGAAYLEHKTGLSGTHQQFIVRVGGGIALDNLEINIFATHYSNGKVLFGWDGPNAGYDFITLQLSYPLR